MGKRGAVEDKAQARPSHEEPSVLTKEFYLNSMGNQEQLTEFLNAFKNYHCGSSIRWVGKRLIGG